MVVAEFLVEYLTSLIAGGGYVLLTVLMALESMIAPVPSEAVMPFAGFLVYEGRFTFANVAFYSTLGSIIGSLLSYYAGLLGGRPLIEKYGRFLLLNKGHLEETEKFFSKFGDKTIFVSRFIPVVRHLISIPAGVGRMNILKFSFYTIVGACLWNMFLAYVGYELKTRWTTVLQYTSAIDLLILAAIVALIAYLVYKRRKVKSRILSS